jgi:hypothetical protein
MELSLLFSRSTSIFLLETLGIAGRMAVSSFTSMILQGIIDAIVFVTSGGKGQPVFQPIFNLSPFYSGLMLSLIEKIPVVGGWFSSLSPGLAEAIVTFIAGWIALGAIIFAFFSLASKWLGLVVGLILGFVAFGLVFGYLKL